jgi:hypothetical protein
MPRLIAIKEHRYASKQMLPGTEYEATDKHAKTLKLIGKAKDAEPAPAAPVVAAAPEPEPPAPAVPRRRYQRRDLRASEE